MKTRSLLAALPLAAAVLAFGAPAGAAEIVLSPTGGGSFAGSSTQAVNGQFIDDFSFSPMAFAGTISVTFASLSGPVTFFTGVLFPDTAAEIDFPNLTDVVGGNFSFAAPVTSSMPLTLRVFGAAADAASNFVAGSYNVAVTSTAAVAAVPEPATYGLLLAGLVGVGIAARRRVR